MEKGKSHNKINQGKWSAAIREVHDYNINTQTREIYLHRYIHTDSETEGDCSIDYRMATGFIKNLTFLNQQGKGNILVHQQSRGGDWNDGIAIYDAIQASIAPITILAYAHARSMTSIILQAADWRVLMPNCDVVIHYGFVGGGEDRVTPALSQAEKLTKEMDVMLGIYIKRCRNGKAFKDMATKEIKAFIRKKLQEKVDWILNPKEAVYYGFADGILGQKGFETIDKIRVD